MAGKKLGAGRKVPPQIVVRVSPELDASLREAAQGLELDISGLVRMVLTEHIAEYIERGRLARKKVRDARRKQRTPKESEREKHPAAQSEAGETQRGHRVVAI